MLNRTELVEATIRTVATNLAEGALRFVLSTDAVSTTIPGARNPRQVETNAAAIDGTLSPDILEKLRTRLGDYNFYQRHGIRL